MDPFLEFMLPPPGETPAQKEARLKREQDAQRVSDIIDEAIRQERANGKKEKNVVKVLLLGQAESGTWLVEMDCQHPLLNVLLQESRRRSKVRCLDPH